MPEQKYKRLSDIPLDELTDDERDVELCALVTECELIDGKYVVVDRRPGRLFEQPQKPTTA